MPKKDNSVTADQQKRRFRLSQAPKNGTKNRHARNDNSRIVLP